jgi:TolB protein
MQRRKFEERKVYSSLEILDIETGKCTRLCEVDYLIEAPNWTQDGNGR